MPATIGEMIRAARVARGWSQTELVIQLRAAWVDANGGGVSKWECGHIRPSTRALAAMVEVLGLDPAEVLEAAGRWPGWSSGSRRR